jgi:hypothetical protein
MGIRGMAVMLWVSGCGGPPAEPACVENTVRCENRCFLVCRPEGWELIRCLTCDESIQAVGAESSRCHIPVVSCEVAS